MQVTDYIPYGRDNAVSRQYLCALTGMRDREIRREIENARLNGELIVNLQDGRGYYRTNDINELVAQYKQNQNRAMRILAQQKMLKQKIDFLKGVESVDYILG